MPEGKTLNIELFGELAALLSLGIGLNDKHPLANAKGVQVTLVAGAGFPLQNQQNKAKLIDKRGSLCVPLNNALEVKMNREEHAGSLSSNWRISITTFVVLVFLISITGCTGKPQPVIQHGGLDQCLSNPKFCTAEDLCRLAIFEEDNIKRWNDDNLRWQPYVREAQKRGLACGL